MTNQSPNRLEVFLALAFGRGAPHDSVKADFLPSADYAAESIDEKISALLAYLTEPETAEFERLRANYQNKTEAEKTDWRASIWRAIGTDEQLIDETIHWSHINEALRKETSAVQKIIADFLPIGHQNEVHSSPNENAPESNAVFKQKAQSEKSAAPLEKTVRRAFAKQFVALQDLTGPTAFDSLSGTQLARLIRLSGIRETALACVRIEAVESVAAFLRRFPAEDARAIAAHLSGLRKTVESRLSFAESLIQTTLEIEPQQPSAMLDLSGVWLIGILLCGSSAMRVRYTNQKLPLEVVTKLPEIIDEHCQNTPKDLQQIISREIEQLAATIARTDANRKGDRKSTER